MKKPKEKPKPEQLEFLHVMAKNGGVSGWCSSVEGAIQIVEG